MTVGIYSGSFNPIHCGHLILANYIAEFTDLDQIWMMVSPANPLKNKKDLLPANVRYNMVSEAIKGYRNIVVSDFELKLPVPSYTIQTLKELNKSYPNISFELIVGADNWQLFKGWKDHLDILHNYKLKIYPRVGYSISIPEKFKTSIEVLDSPILEISSTFIRESIAEGKDIKSFMPDSVYKYIKENSLYQ